MNFCRKPSLFGDHDFHMIFVTHVSILTSDLSSIFHKISSLNTERSATEYMYLTCTPTASVIYLRPDTFSVIISSTSELLRFLERMAASKPTSWLSMLATSKRMSLSSFPTQYIFWDLSVWSGLFPSRLWTLAPKVCLLIGFSYWVRNYLRYSEFPWVRYRFGQPSPKECSTPKDIFNERSTYIDFAENQLSPSSFGFSPLVTSHPRLLPQTWVRSSRKYYPSFNLLMTRSLGFGFKFWDYTLFNVSTDFLRLHLSA